MRRLLLLSAAVLALAACSTTQVSSAHLVAEKAETLAETLYGATAQSLDGLLLAGKISQATHDRSKLQAWQALQDVRTQYNLGLLIDLSVLQAQAATAGVSPAIINGAS